MYPKNLEKLEYNKVLKILSSFAITEVGKNISISLLPCSDLESANYALTQTTESYVLLYRKGAPPLAEIPDISIHIKALESQGSLSAGSILDLAHILKLSRELKEYFYAEDVDTEFCINLSTLFSNLYTNFGIEQKVFSAILDEDTVDDHASPTLWHIRKDIQKIESEIKQKLNSYLHASYIQEPIVTIRAGRYVIPVKQEQQSQIKGFVHDISSSGSTVFIEPTTIFDMNNKLNSLKSEEKNEIEKILHDLTSLFYPYIEELNENVKTIGQIDFAFAKAKYARSINATEPILQKEKNLNFVKARHPLIEADKVVPINVYLGETFTSLIVTGPNTGGKTVTLKTVGLLCAMAASGLYIPASEKSSCFVFDNIFADIGDEQSIQESLSTFSSHMTNIIEILSNSTSDSLVLLDELGSGTDPIEGSSLAISILEALHKKGCLAVSTTHYPEVKNFALVTDGFENASSEFDVETLKPTYKLLIGIPGQSNAFAISKRLGLSEEILNEAKSLVSENKVSIEELLKSIYDDRKFIEEEKEKIIERSKEIDELKSVIEKQKEDILQSQSDNTAKAKSEAREILISAKEEADEIIRQLETTTSASKANKLRKKLKDKIADVSKNEDVAPSSPLKEEDIVIGNFVRVVPLGIEGSILSLPDKSRKNSSSS
ncbi:MAG: endonuclease MutS2 [Clostridia bacterium]|nr:endonuclease MutS2 [Clostridia bacterium]